MVFSAPSCVEVSAASWVLVSPSRSGTVRLSIWVAASPAICVGVSAPSCVVVSAAIPVAFNPAS